MDEATACRDALALTRRITAALLEMESNQELVAAGDAAHRAMWNDLRRAQAVLGERHPFHDMPTAWDWYARSVAGSPAGSDQRDFLAGRTAGFIARLEARLKAVEGKRPERAFQSHYYRDRRGRCPVVDYMNELHDPTTAARLRGRISMLNELTRDQPYLARPSGAPLAGTADGFYELRVKTNAQHRIIYAPFGSRFILLHAFQKQGWDVPENEKEIALRRWNDMLDRLETEPDPIGQGAP